MPEITSRLSTALAGKLLLVAVAVALPARSAEGQNAEMLRLICDEGNAAGCSDLGVMYDNGTGVTQDFARAARLYQQACDGGEGTGCYNLGQLYMNGEGVTRDLAHAVSLYQQACENGEAMGCYNLGVVYDEESWRRSLHSLPVGGYAASGSHRVKSRRAEKPDTSVRSACTTT